MALEDRGRPLGENGEIIPAPSDILLAGARVSNRATWILEHFASDKVVYNDKDYSLGQGWMLEPIGSSGYVFILEKSLNGDKQVSVFAEEKLDIADSEIKVSMKLVQKQPGIFLDAQTGAIASLEQLTILDDMLKTISCQLRDDDESKLSQADIM